MPPPKRPKTGVSWMNDLLTAHGERPAPLEDEEAKADASSTQESDAETSSTLDIDSCDEPCSPHRCPKVEASSSEDEPIAEERLERDDPKEETRKCEEQPASLLISILSKSGDPRTIYNSLKGNHGYHTQGSTSSACSSSSLDPELDLLNPGSPDPPAGTIGSHLSRIIVREIQRSDANSETPQTEISQPEIPRPEIPQPQMGHVESHVQEEAGHALLPKLSGRQQQNHHSMDGHPRPPPPPHYFNPVTTAPRACVIAPVARKIRNSSFQHPTTSAPDYVQSQPLSLVTRQFNNRPSHQDRGESPDRQRNNGNPLIGRLHHMLSDPSNHGNGLNCAQGVSISSYMDAILKSVYMSEEQRKRTNVHQHQQSHSPVLPSGEPSSSHHQPSSEFEHRHSSVLSPGGSLVNLDRPSGELGRGSVLPPGEYFPSDSGRYPHAVEPPCDYRVTDSDRKVPPPAERLRSPSMSKWPATCADPSPGSPPAGFLPSHPTDIGVRCSSQSLSPVSQSASTSPVHDMSFAMATAAEGDSVAVPASSPSRVVSPISNGAKHNGCVSARRCQICSDAASGFHYGVWSCEGCKAFFKRSLQGPVDYICPATNNCTIDKHRRKSCQACRLAKCVGMGMSRGTCREKRSTKSYNNSSKRKLDAAATAPGPDTPAPPTPKHSRMSPEFPDMHTTVIKKEPKVCPVHPLGPVAMAIPPVQALVEHLIHLEPPFPLALIKDSADYKTKVYAMLTQMDRQLMDVVAWAKGVPGYMELPLSERMELMEMSWMEILLLGLLWQSFAHEDVVAFAPDLHVTRNQLQKDGLGVILQKLLSLITKARALELGREELVLIRASVLLNAGVCNLSANAKFLDLQHQITDALHYTVTVRRRRPPTDLPRLLLLLPQLRQLALEFSGYLGTLRDDGALPPGCTLLREVLTSPAQGGAETQGW